MKKNTINSRSYNEFFKIAQQCIEALSNRSDVIFTEVQLRIICIDYTFNTLENFLEHIGYILFCDWDSSNKQRHYNNKIEKILKVSEAISNPDRHSNLIKRWKTLIKSINISKYAKSRNPLKHTHSNKHDIKTIKLLDNYSSKSLIHDRDEFKAIIEGTIFDITNDNCLLFFHEVKTYIEEIHAFIKKNQPIFKIYSLYSNDKVENRKSLFHTFVLNQHTPTLLTSHISLFSNN